MRRMEIGAAVLMLALAGFVVWAVSGLAYWSRLVPGPAFMPIWAAIVGALLGVAMLATAVMRKDDAPVDLPERASLFRLLVTYAMLWGIVAAAPAIGFLTAAMAFMLATLLLVFRRPALPSLAITAIIGLMVHFLFNHWLNVRLPTGPLGV
jgi:membrane-associated HD superfamily phosphohydrolase